MGLHRKLTRGKLKPLVKQKLSAAELLYKLTEILLYTPDAVTEYYIRNAIIYSLAESAKINNLKPFNYFKYILEELPKHQDDTNLDFLDSLLPWTPEIPDDCRKQNR